MTRKNARGVGGREKVTAAFPWSRVSLFSLVLILWPPYYLIVWHRWRLLPIKFTYFIYLLVCYLRKQFKPTWKQRRGAIPISLWLQRCSKAITKTGGFRGQLVSLPPPHPTHPPKVLARISVLLSPPWSPAVQESAYIKEWRHHGIVLLHQHGRRENDLLSLRRPGMSGLEENIFKCI